MLSGSSLFFNTVLYGNTSSVSGSARGLNAYVGASTALSVTGSVIESALAANAVWGAGSGSFNYDNVYNSVGSAFGGTLAAGAGYVSSGGNFVRARCDGNAYNDSFMLASGSVGIDAGDPGTSDVDGSRSDMGAYGGPGGVWSL